MTALNGRRGNITRVLALLRIPANLRYVGEVSLDLRRDSPTVFKVNLRLFLRHLAIVPDGERLFVSKVSETTEKLLFEATDLGASPSFHRDLEIFDSVKVTLDAGPPELPGTANVIVEVTEAASVVTGELGCFTKPTVRGEFPVQKCRVVLDSAEFSEKVSEQELASTFADIVTQMFQDAKWMVDYSIVPLRLFQERCEEEFLWEAEMIKIKAQELKSKEVMECFELLPDSNVFLELIPIFPKSHASQILGFKFQHYQRLEVTDPVPFGLYKLTALLVKENFIDLDSMQCQWKLGGIICSRHNLIIKDVTNVESQDLIEAALKGYNSCTWS